MGRGQEPPLAKGSPHEAQAGDSDSASYASSEAEGVVKRHHAEVELGDSQEPPRMKDLGKSC